MPLTSRDETDLLLPLFAGFHEERRFSSFLETLKRRTRAEYIGLIFRSAESANTEATEYFAGRDLRAQARAAGIPELLGLDRLHYDQLRPGRVYSIAELIEHDPVYRSERARFMRKLGLVDERVIRLVGIEGHAAWLVLARNDECSAADAALLSNLAPYLAEALRTMILLERQQVEQAISAHGLARSGTAWILFDQTSRVLAIDPAFDRNPQKPAAITPVPGERLRGIGQKPERQLAAAAQAFADDATSDQRTIVLSESPRVEALLLSASDLPRTSAGAPAMLALCRLPRAGSADRALQLAGLLDLPRREAELAIALYDGLSLAEAAEAMGLTIETTRNYSKRLYAKMGVRGQAELVRSVYESVVALA